MIIEVRGTGTHNKGAELMLCAIRQHYCRAESDVQLAVDPFFGSYADRARYGLLSKVRPIGLGRAAVAQRMMSPAFRKTYGLVVDSDIDAVLDASGFAYGDQWGMQPTQTAAREAIKLRRTGRTLVLLPQAFGPFSGRELASQARRLIESAALVFARDDASFRHVQELGGPYEHVHRAPDFSMIVTGCVPSAFDSPANLVCVVPNIRMLDRGTESDRNAYVGFLAACIREAREHDLEPMYLFHDAATDRQVAEMVDARLGFPLARIDESRPERLKGILGQAHVVVGSRFHALVGALSQAVPCIVAGWSHKYEMLLQDFGCEPFLLSPTSPDEDIRTLFDRVTDARLRGEIVARLRERGDGLRAQVDAMFRRVDETLAAREAVPA
ncbi:MAG: polysaccharide pyruvyl transferase family protein [Planctomycetaceae bacterium]